MKVYQLENIKRNHNGNVILEDISLSFDPGMVYALIGENGSGKTTLLETLALLEAPQDGTLFFLGQEVKFKQKPHQLRRKISFCQQHPLLFKTSVFNNIAFGARVRGENHFEKMAKDISLDFGLFHLLNKNSAYLSGGEIQRVALARTFILETPVILLDEPTANLDEAGIAVVENYLQKLKGKGTTIILATHHKNIAYRLADEAITIKDRRAFAQSHENFFSGIIEKTIGLKTFNANDKVSFIIATEKTGRVKISIDPKEIIVSKDKFDSSARNSFSGRVCSIVDEGNLAKVTVDCKGVKLISQITHKSLHELGINVGKKVYLTFKTSSIKVY